MPFWFSVEYVGETRWQCMLCATNSTPKVAISCLPSTIESSLHLVLIVSCYKERLSWFHIRTKCLIKDFESKLRVMWNFVEVLQSKGKLKPLPFICQSTSNYSTISNSLLVPPRPKIHYPRDTRISRFRVWKQHVQLFEL